MQAYARSSNVISPRDSPSRFEAYDRISSRIIISAHIINTVAFLLLILGYFDSQRFYPNFVQVSPTVKAGGYLQCSTTLIIMVICLHHFQLLDDTSNKVSGAIITYVLIASIPMAMRIGYWTYRLQTDHLLNDSTSSWVLQLVFQYIPEMIAVTILIFLGHTLSQIRKRG